MAPRAQAVGQACQSPVEHSSPADVRGRRARRRPFRHYSVDQIRRAYSSQSPLPSGEEATDEAERREKVGRLTIGTQVFHGEVAPARAAGDGGRRQRAPRAGNMAVTIMNFSGSARCVFYGTMTSWETE